MDRRLTRRGWPSESLAYRYRTIAMMEQLKARYQQPFLHNFTSQALCWTSIVLLVAAAFPSTAMAMNAKACAAGAANSHYSTNVTPGLSALSQGLSALRSHNPKYAVGRFKVAASWGSKIAQYNLGLMYWSGYGSGKNRPLAVA